MVASRITLDEGRFRLSVSRLCATYLGLGGVMQSVVVHVLYLAMTGCQMIDTVKPEKFRNLAFHDGVEF